MSFFGIASPAVRLAIGVVVLVIGITLHQVLFDITGAVLIVLGASQWIYRR